MKHVNVLIGLCCVLALSSCSTQDTTTSQAPTSEPTSVVDFQATISVQSTQIAAQDAARISPTQAVKPEETLTPEPSSAHLQLEKERYVDKEFGVSLAIPLGWKVEKPGPAERRIMGGMIDNFDFRVVIWNQNFVGITKPSKFDDLISWTKGQSGGVGKLISQEIFEIEGGHSIAKFTRDSDQGTRFIAYLIYAGDRNVPSSSFAIAFFVRPIDRLGEYDALIDQSIKSIRLTTKPALPYKLLASDYQLSDAKDGWREGSIKLALENNTDEVVLGQFTLPCNKGMFVETKEGPQYGAQLAKRFSNAGNAVAVNEPIQVPAANGPIPPGFRFRGIDSMLEAGYLIFWRSAEAATPLRIRFTECLEVIIDLPTEKNKPINLPFDVPPKQMESFAALKGVKIIDQPQGITAMYTGECFYTKSGMNSEQEWYSLEVQVSNADKFNEQTAKLPQAMSFFYANGEVDFLQWPTFSPKFGSGSQDLGGVVRAGPGQTEIVYLSVRGAPPGDTQSQTTTLIWNDANNLTAYNAYHARDCKS